MAHHHFFMQPNFSNKGTHQHIHIWILYWTIVIKWIVRKSFITFPFPPCTSGDARPLLSFLLLHSRIEKKLTKPLLGFTSVASPCLRMSNHRSSHIWTGVPPHVPQSPVTTPANTDQYQELRWRCQRRGRRQPLFFLLRIREQHRNHHDISHVPANRK